MHGCFVQQAYAELQWKCKNIVGPLSEEFYIARNAAVDAVGRSVCYEVVGGRRAGWSKPYIAGTYNESCCIIQPGCNAASFAISERGALRDGRVVLY